MKKFNHAFSIMFTVETVNDGQNVTKEELLTGLKKRYVSLCQSGEEIIEACGMPDDTYEFEEK